MSQINVPDVPHAPRAPAPQPEPVTWRDLNGRPPGGWDTGFGFALLPPVDGGFEEDAIVAARKRERAQEWRP